MVDLANIPACPDGWEDMASQLLIQGKDALAQRRLMMYEKAAKEERRLRDGRQWTVSILDEICNHVRPQVKWPVRPSVTSVGPDWELVEPASLPEGTDARFHWGYYTMPIEVRIAKESSLQPTFPMPVASLVREKISNYSHLLCINGLWHLLQEQKRRSPRHQADSTSQRRILFGLLPRLAECQSVRSCLLHEAEK